MLPLPLLLAPLFVEHTAYLGAQPCGPGATTGCYTNYLQLADLDGDGALDVLIPNAEGYFEQDGGGEPLVWLRNDGGFTFTDRSADLGGGFSGWLRQVAIGDVDGDGSLDVYAPSAWGDADALFINDGAGHFTDEAASRLGGFHAHAGAARFADVDGDGDLDLIVAEWGQPDPTAGGWSIDLFLNDGTGHFTLADSQLPTVPAGSPGTPVDVDDADVDGDIDLDLLIDLHDHSPKLWLNDGSGHFTDATTQLDAVQSGLHYNPVFCDVDGDGALDLFVDNAGDGSTNEELQMNDGTGHFTDESAARLDAAGDFGSDDNGVACLDVDGDGHFDAAVASLSGNERVLANDGTGHFTLVAGAFTAESDSTLWLDFGDLNGDGRLDAVTGQGESGNFLNRLYVGTNGLAADTRPPQFRAIEPVAAMQNGSPVRIRFAVEDESTSDVGPRLSDAHVAYTLAGGAAQSAKATFMGGDLFRAVIPGQAPGATITWHVCATDLAGNQACSTDATYSVVCATCNTTPGGGKHGCSCELGEDSGSLYGSLLVAAAIAFARRRRRT